MQFFFFFVFYFFFLYSLSHCKILRKGFFFPLYHMGYCSESNLMCVFHVNVEYAGWVKAGTKTLKHLFDGFSRSMKGCAHAAVSTQCQCSDSIRWVDHLFCTSGRCFPPSKSCFTAGVLGFTLETKSVFKSICRSNI